MTGPGKKKKRPLAMPWIERLFVPIPKLSPSRCGTVGGGGVTRDGSRIYVQGPREPECASLTHTARLGADGTGPRAASSEPRHARGEAHPHPHPPGHQSRVVPPPPHHPAPTRTRGPAQPARSHACPCLPQSGSASSRRRVVFHPSPSRPLGFRPRPVGRVCPIRPCPTPARILGVGVKPPGDRSEHRSRHASRF